MALRIGIDMDGVLADFRSAFHATARACLGQEMEDADDPAADRSLLERDVKRVWDRVARTPNWWMTLQPYEPEQIARLYALTRAAGWEIFFLTKRPSSAGDTVQFQTQSWIERYGFYLPAVLTVPGSRGELANALRLDVVIDDLVLNCVEVISASTAKALLLLRHGDAAAKAHALNRGIGVVSTFDEALGVLEQLQEVLPNRRGRLLRLADWFSPAKTGEPLPHNPRLVRPMPVDKVAGGSRE
jgi:hypothetical protein